MLASRRQEPARGAHTRTFVIGKSLLHLLHRARQHFTWPRIDSHIFSGEISASGEPHTHSAQFCKRWSDLGPTILSPTQANTTYMTSLLEFSPYPLCFFTFDGESGLYVRAHSSTLPCPLSLFLFLPSTHKTTCLELTWTQTHVTQTTHRHRHKLSLLLLSSTTRGATFLAVHAC